MTPFTFVDWLVVCAAAGAGAATGSYDGATLDDLREAVTTLEETARIARRMLGSAHPVVRSIEHHLPISRAMLRAREAHPSGSS